MSEATITIRVQSHQWDTPVPCSRGMVTTCKVLTVRGFVWQVVIDHGNRRWTLAPQRSADIFTGREHALAVGQDLCRRVDAEDGSAGAMIEGLVKAGVAVEIELIWHEDWQYGSDAWGDFAWQDRPARRGDTR